MRRALVDGFRALYCDPDVRLRSAAVLFFASYSADPGTLAIETLRDHLGLFDDIGILWRQGCATCAP